MNLNPVLNGQIRKQHILIKWSFPLVQYKSKIILNVKVSIKGLNFARGGSVVNGATAIS